MVKSWLFFVDSFNQRRNLRLKYADHASDILSLRRENDKQKTKELLVESDLDFLRCADQGYKSDDSDSFVCVYVSSHDLIGYIIHAYVRRKLFQI